MSRHALGVVVRLSLTFAVPVIVFELLLDPWRETEAQTVAGIFDNIGVAGASHAFGYQILVLPATAAPFLATISPSCSALAAILAFASISLFLVRGEPLRRFVAFLAASGVVIVCNLIRIGLSVYIGLETDVHGLTIFHDWVGTAFGLLYVLGGFTVYLWMLLPSNRRLLAEYEHARAQAERDPRVAAGVVSDDVRLGLVVGGIAAIVIAFVWRFVVISGRQRQIRRGLEATDPQDRARAGIVLVDEGLQRSARPLLAHLAAEADPRVCHAIALAVARRQWEPVDTLRVRQLREWASQELQRRGEPVQSFGPAMTRLSDMGGPRPPDNEQQAAKGQEHALHGASDVEAPAGSVQPSLHAPLHAVPEAAAGRGETEDDPAPPAVSWHAETPGAR